MSEKSSDPTSLSLNCTIPILVGDKFHINYFGEESFFVVDGFDEPYWITGMLYFVGKEEDAEHAELHREDLGKFVYKLERENNNVTNKLALLKEPSGEEQPSLPDIYLEP